MTWLTRSVLIFLLGWPVVSVVSWSFLASAVLAQKTSTSVDAKANKTIEIAPQKNPTAERSDSLTEFEEGESKAITFVKKHHPELVSLLQLLKAMREKEYEAAIREILRIETRLEALAKREPALHDIELDAWKLQSKIDLMLAQGYVKNKAFDKKTLRQLLKDQVEVQKRRLRHEEAALAKRQSQLSDLINKLEGHEEEKVEQQLSSLMKRVDAQANKLNKSKPESKPAKEAKGKTQ